MVRLIMWNWRLNIILMQYITHIHQIFVWYAWLCITKEEMKELKWLTVKIIIYIHPMFFSKLILGEQKPRMAFLQGREDDTNHIRPSTFTLSFEQYLKVNAMLKSKSYCFPWARLLLGLYDYRLKHIAILEEIDATTTTTFHFCYSDYCNDQDDDLTKELSRATPSPTSHVTQGDNAYKVTFLKIMLWVQHSMSLIYLHASIKRIKSRGRLLLKRGRMMRTSLVYLIHHLLQMKHQQSRKLKHQQRRHIWVPWHGAILNKYNKRWMRS